MVLAKSENDGSQPLAILVDYKADYLQVEGKERVRGIGAEWNAKLLRQRGAAPGVEKGLEKGPLCPLTPLYFEEKNRLGMSNWGTGARGALIVAVRGEVEFETMARRAEACGARGLVVVDDNDVWEDDWDIAVDDPRRPPPAVPIVVVPKTWEEVLCKEHTGLQAEMWRELDNTLSKEDAKTLQFMRMRGAEVCLKLQK
eukprot:TRINITY_DN7915_c0_g1_i1.p2 TRINITY_DN7915_c0_g1~~TRINITY_DN7915_c0_g1_i1.p2  ORF type:complete len:214 (-),score=54.28 TRINITY_DN7915_c0_g1_i1:154-750(-)